MTRATDFIESIDEIYDQTSSDQLHNKLNFAIERIIKEVHDVDVLQQIFASLSHRHRRLFRDFNEIITASLPTSSSLLKLAVEYDNIAFINYLVSLDSVKREIANNPDILSDALIEQKLDIACLLIDFGANPMVATKDGPYGASPLMTGLVEHRAICLSWLSNLPSTVSDLNTTDLLGRNVVHYAAGLGERAVIDLLISKGVDINKKDMFGKSPLDYALHQGHLEIAQVLSGQSIEDLRADPRYNNSLPSINHSLLVDKIISYLKLKGKEVKEGDKIDIPDITRGICNGWSFLGALYAAKGKKKLKEFYTISNLLCSWDGRESSLQESPTGLPDDFKNLGSCFNQITNDLFWFFQQEATNKIISHDAREHQLRLISDQTSITRLTDFCLDDLTRDEEKLILEMYKPIMQNTIIDMSTSGWRDDAHTISFYQDIGNNIHYLDPNIPMQLPSYGNYSDAIDITHKVLPSNVVYLRFFSLQPPDAKLAQIKEEAERITKQIIKKLVIDHPMRQNDIKNIFEEAGMRGSPVMLKLLLTMPEVKEKLSKQVIMEGMFLCHGCKKLSSLYTMFKFQEEGVSFSDLYNESRPMLITLLSSAIQEDDEKLFRKLKTFILSKGMELPLDLQWEPFPKKAIVASSVVSEDVTMVAGAKMVGKQKREEQPQNMITLFDLQEALRKEKEKIEQRVISLSSQATPSLIEANKQKMFWLNKILAYYEKTLNITSAKHSEIIEIVQNHIQDLEKLQKELKSENKQFTILSKKEVTDFLEEPVEKFNEMISPAKGVSVK